MSRRALKRRYGRSSGAGGPPDTMNVIDRHGGFTAMTKTGREGELLYKRTIGQSSLAGDSLWRPGSLLKRSTTGKLIDYARNSFYQNNNDVTVALYRVPGYRYPVAVWIDNRTGARIA